MCDWLHGPLRTERCAGMGIGGVRGRWGVVGGGGG